MLNRSEPEHIDLSNYQPNGRVKFPKGSSHFIKFTKLLYFYLDKLEDIFAFGKRELSLGGDAILISALRALAKITPFTTQLKPGPASVASKVVFEFLERLLVNLSLLSMVVSCIQGAFLIYKALFFVAFSTEDKYTRAVQFIAGVAAVGLTVVGLLVTFSVLTIASPILLVVGASRTLAEHSIAGIVAIFNRFFSHRSHVVQARIKTLKATIKSDKGTKEDLKELTALIQEQREGNERVIGRTQASLQAIGMLVSGILLMTPAAPIGTILLISVTGFALTDALVGTVTKQNTLRMLTRGANALLGLVLSKSPFNLEVKSEADIQSELEHEIGHRIQIQATPEKPSIHPPSLLARSLEGEKELDQAAEVAPQAHSTKGKEKVGQRPSSHRHINKTMTAQHKNAENNLITSVGAPTKELITPTQTASRNLPVPNLSKNLKMVYPSVTQSFAAKSLLRRAFDTYNTRQRDHFTTQYNPVPTTSQSTPPLMITGGKTEQTSTSARPSNV